MDPHNTLQRFPRRRRPYGENVGDIWTIGGDVGERLLTEKRLLGIIEVFADASGEPEERIYSVELDNPDPDMQDLMARARRGTYQKIAAEASRN